MLASQSLTPAQDGSAFGFGIPVDIALCLAIAAAFAWGWSPLVRWSARRFSNAEGSAKAAWLFAFSVFGTWSLLGYFLDLAVPFRFQHAVRLMALVVAVVAPPIFVRRLFTRPMGTPLPYAHALRVAMMTALVPAAFFLTVAFAGLSFNK